MHLIDSYNFSNVFIDFCQFIDLRFEYALSFLGQNGELGPGGTHTSRVRYPSRLAVILECDSNNSQPNYLHEEKISIAYPHSNGTNVVTQAGNVLTLRRGQVPKERNVSFWRPEHSKLSNKW